MITADKLALLINMPSDMLTTGIQSAGYKKDKFTKSKFLGMSNAGLFVYSATYIENNEECNTKVFVKYDPTADKVTVDY